MDRWGEHHWEVIRKIISQQFFSQGKYFVKDGISLLDGSKSENEDIADRNKCGFSPTYKPFYDGYDFKSALYGCFLCSHFFNEKTANEYFSKSLKIVIEAINSQNLDELRQEISGLNWFVGNGAHSRTIGDHRRYFMTRSPHEKQELNDKAICGFVKWEKQNRDMLTKLSIGRDNIAFEDLYISMKEIESFALRLPRWDFTEIINEWLIRTKKSTISPLRLFLEERTHSGPWKGFNKLLEQVNPGAYKNVDHIEIEKRVCSIVYKLVVENKIGIPNDRIGFLLFDFESSLCNWQKSNWLH